MKKIMMLLAIFCFMFQLSTPVTFAKEDKIYFAKVQSTGVMFLSQKSDDSALFELPFSYFVKVESVDGDYFSAEYQNKKGFVKKDAVRLMDGVPKQPYASVDVKLYLPFSLYESPSKNSESLSTILEGESLSFYGFLSGQPLNSTTDEWLYVSTSDGDFGYVYSTLLEKRPKPAENFETFQTVEDDVLNGDNPEFATLSLGTKIILIVSISVPSVLILYFLIKPSKFMQPTKQKAKKERKKVQHGDYFEFDESQL